MGNQFVATQRKTFSVKMKSFVFFGTFFVSLLTSECKTLEKNVTSAWQNVGEGDIFYHVGSLPMNYYEANDYCQLEGGILAEPRSSSQTEDIMAFLDPDYSYWIGLTDLQTEALFLWNSDDQNTESYHNWYPGEPNSSGDCALLWGPHNEGQWDDAPCDYDIDHGYIKFALCQKST